MKKLKDSKPVPFLDVMYVAELELSFPVFSLLKGLDTVMLYTDGRSMESKARWGVDLKSEYFNSYFTIDSGHPTTSK
jgi:hypothetical protein